MTLKLDLYGSLASGDKRHAQDIMKSLGITYEVAVPQSLFDCWIFYCCSDVPKVLPAYLTELKVDPIKHIGSGISAETAMFIKAWEANPPGYWSRALKKNRKKLIHIWRKITETPLR